jgi:RNA polymerase sigma factor (sigma-70 family)
MQDIEKKQFIEHIYHKFWKELYVVAFRRLRSEQDVEDILHDIFLSLLTGNAMLDNDESVRALLHLRLKSRIINFYRKQLIQITYQEQEALKSDLSDLDSDSRLMGLELGSIIQEEINRMPEKMKEIFLLSRNDLKTTEEIATLLNLSKQTVLNQISAAIKRIRAAVSVYGQPGLQPAALYIAITLGVLLLTNY